jgi:hypothetical protein
MRTYMKCILGLAFLSGMEAIDFLNHKAHDEWKKERSLITNSKSVAAKKDTIKNNSIDYRDLFQLNAEQMKPMPYPGNTAPNSLGQFVNALH